MQNIFKVINMAARTLSLMIISRWKSRDGSRRQVVSGGKKCFVGFSRWKEFASIKSLALALQ